MRYLEIAKPTTDTISAATDASYAEALTKQRKSQLASVILHCVPRLSTGQAARPNASYGRKALSLPIVFLY